jgi:microcystin-dependent protein
MKTILFILSFFFATQISSAQNVAINSDGSTPDASAMLDVKSTTQGFLPPRLTQAQRTAIATPATGLIVYQSDNSAGYYFYTGTEWIMLGETPGVIKQYAGASAPAGYLLCQGQAVSRTTYAALFQVISTTYGSGNGSTTFNLPDLRTRVPVGLNSSGTFNALNNKGGTETHTITVAQMPSHNHGGFTNNGTNDGSHSHTATSTGQAWGGGGVQNGSFPAGTSFSLSTVTTTVNTTNSAHRHVIASQGGGSAIPIVQPYIVLNYIIKY